MVLQIGADTGQVKRHRDAQALQQGGGADARQLQNLRRADGPGGQQHLAARLQRDMLQTQRRAHLGPGAAQLAVHRLQRQALHL